MGDYRVRKKEGPLTGADPTVLAALDAVLRVPGWALWAALAVGLGIRSTERPWRQQAARLAPWLLALWAVLLTVPRLGWLDVPFETDQETQRVLIATLDPVDLLLHRYPDNRHPMLYYLLLHLFASVGDLSPVSMRTPAVLATGVALAGVGWVTRRVAGFLPAMLAMALLAMNPGLWDLSRDVSDAPQFAALALLTGGSVWKAVRHPESGWPWAAALVAVAAMHTLYMGVLVVGATLATVLIHARDRRFAGPGLLASLLCAPAIRDFVLVVDADRATRALADRYLQHHWGQWAPVEYLQAVLALVVPGSGPAIGLAVVAFGFVATATRRWTALHSYAALLLVGSLAVIALAPETVRMKPYYLLHLAPWFAVWAGAAAAQVGSRPAGVAALGALGAGWLLSQDAAALRDQIAHPPRLRELPLALALVDGPARFVSDPGNLYTQLVHGAAPDPAAAYRTCAFFEDHTRCEAEGFRYRSLTDPTALGEGWEARSLDRWQTIDEAHTFVVDHGFPNPPLVQAVQARCVPRFVGLRFQLYDCPPR